MVPTLTGAVRLRELRPRRLDPRPGQREGRRSTRALRTYSSVHRGNGLGLAGDQRVVRAGPRGGPRVRRAGAQDEVVFTRNSTDSFNLLARALPPRTDGLRVRVRAPRGPAALADAPNRTTCRCPAAPTTPPGPAARRRSTEHRATNRLVVLAGASNVTGEVWPVRELAADRPAGWGPGRSSTPPSTRPTARSTSRARRRLRRPSGAQALRAVRSRRPRRSPGLARRRHPYLAGGGATKAVTERGVLWHEGPARHEAGSPNVIGAIALAAACHALRTHRSAIEAHEELAGRRLLEGLEAIDGRRDLLAVRRPATSASRSRPSPSTGCDSSLVSAGPVGRARHRRA